MPKQITPKSQAAWRSWLEKNYLKEKEVYLIHYKKHTGKRAMSAQEAMDEAICFGWIDTIVKRLDDEKYIQKFAQRNEKSKWSDNTLKYAERLIKEGRMSPHGVKMYREGKKKPTHDSGIPKNPTIPTTLKAALTKENLLEQFNEYPPSYKKMVLRWFLSAKQEETQQKRITRIVDVTKQGKRLFTSQ